MNPLEMSRVLNSPAMLPYKEQAVQLVSAQYGQPAGDAWFRDPRVEAVALLLFSGALAVPGSNVPPAADPRIAQTRAALLAIADKLRA